MKTHPDDVVLLRKAVYALASLVDTGMCIHVYLSTTVSIRQCFCIA